MPRGYLLAQKSKTSATANRRGIKTVENICEVIDVSNFKTSAATRQRKGVKTPATSAASAAPPDWEFGRSNPRINAALAAAHRAVSQFGGERAFHAEALTQLARVFESVAAEQVEAAFKCYDDDRNGLAIVVSMSTQLMAVRGPVATDTLSDAHSISLLAARVAEAAGHEGGADALALGRAASILAELSAGLVTAGLFFLSEERCGHD